jgi:hypothetical protein
MQIDGDCAYIREVKTTYQCERDGKIDRTIVAPTAPD